MKPPKELNWVEFNSPKELCEWLLLAGKKLNKDKCNPEYVCCDGTILKQNQKGEWENDRSNRPPS